MKLLCIADHTINLNSEDINQADIVCLLGDLKQDQLSSLHNTIKPIIGVYGNHCSPGYLESLGENIHLKYFSKNNLSFFGLEGCVKYKQGNFQYTQTQYKQMLLNNFKGCDILLSHCPPQGINDCPLDDAHLGIDYLTNLTPDIKIIIHGHTYPKNEFSQHNNCLIIHIDGAKLIDLNNLPSISTLPKASSYESKNIIINPYQI